MVRIKRYRFNMRHHEAGKGDDPRPCSISQFERGLRYDYAFRKDHLSLGFDAWVEITGQKERLENARKKFKA